MAQLVEALDHYTEGRGFDSRWGIFRVIWSFCPLSLQQKWGSRDFLGDKGGRCVMLTTIIYPRHRVLLEKLTTPIQSIPPSHFSKIRFNIILLPTPGSSKRSLPSDFPTKTCKNISFPNTRYMPCPSQTPSFHQGWQLYHRHKSTFSKSWRLQPPGDLGAYLGLCREIFTFLPHTTTFFIKKRCENLKLNKHDSTTINTSLS